MTDWWPLSSLWRCAFPARSWPLAGALRRPAPMGGRFDAYLQHIAPHSRRDGIVVVRRTTHRSGKLPILPLDQGDTMGGAERKTLSLPTHGCCSSCKARPPPKGRSPYAASGQEVSRPVPGVRAEGSSRIALERDRHELHGWLQEAGRRELCAGGSGLRRGAGEGQGAAPRQDRGRVGP